MAQYTSKYYDPVKAHQYYEEHKKLKGRKASTSKLSDTGKNAASYVKEQINKEKKESIESESKRYSNSIFETTSEAKAKISQLQKKFKKLSTAQKKILGPKIKNELQKLKEENARKRLILETQHSKNISNINDKYSKIYDEEVNKMNADSSMKKQTKTSSTKNKSKSTKKSTKKSTSTRAKSVEEQIAEKRKEARELMKKKKK